MAEVLTVNMNRKPVYDIQITDSFDELSEKIKSIGLEGRKTFVITDDTVEPLYADALKQELAKVCSEVTVYAFKAGEKSKNLDTVRDILRAMVEAHINRSDFVTALGGGVVGDVAGFCASIFMRGIPVVQVPTTLLAQVDSSVGGKTGVDFDDFKNMVGAFKMPALVYINTSTLNSLPGRLYYAGMGEVLKYGLIMDASFYEWLIDHMYEIHDKDKAVLNEMVLTCCSCKQKIVERDPFETGDRALLNFGHTIGHAIEKYKGFELLHGECVALGCVAAAFISWKKDKLSMDEFYEIRDMFVPFNLPISVDDLDPEKILELTRSDKKNTTDEGMRFILLKKVGKAYIDKNVSDDEILAAIEEINFTEEDRKA